MTVKEKNAKEDPPKEPHNTLCVFFGLVFLSLAYLSSKQPLVAFLCAAAILEFVNVLLFASKNRFFMLVYLLYQTMLSVVPIFVVSTVVYAQFDRASVNAFLESAHLQKFLEFCNTDPFFFAGTLFALWCGRVGITYVVVTYQFFLWKKDTVTNGDKRIRDVLNLTAFTFFVMMAHFGNQEHQKIFFGLAIFELLMAFSYVFDSLQLMIVHFLYQAVAFSVPTCLLAATVYHCEAPVRTIEFLNSYGLTNVSGFVRSSPLFATSMLFLAWCVRLMILEMDIINKDIKEHVQQIRRDQPKNQVPKAAGTSPNGLIDRQQPLIDTV